MSIDKTAVILSFLATLLPAAAYSQTPATPPPDPPQNPPTFQDTVQVTATRFGEPVAEVPGSISVVTGDEIRARGATDLRTALALLGGVSVAPGGDAGPAGAVPGLLGVREVDDLLLLIDGIPAGGAFIPQIEAVSLNNVERIEVMRGAAPVYYGTTAFAGTINVIHYAAGSADRVTGVRFGSYQSGGIGGAAVLSAGRVRQSLSAELTPEQLLRRARRLRPRAGHLASRHAAWRRNVPGRRRRPRAAPETEQPGAHRRSDRRVQHAAAGRLQPEPGELFARHQSLQGRPRLRQAALVRPVGKHGRLYANERRQRPRLHRRRRHAAAVDDEDQRRSRIVPAVTESQGAVHRQQPDDETGEEDGPDRRRQSPGRARRCGQPALRSATAARRRQPGAEHRNGHAERHRQSQRQPPVRRLVCAEPHRDDIQHEPAGRSALEHHSRNARGSSCQQPGRQDCHTGRPGCRSPHRIDRRSVASLAQRRQSHQRGHAARQRRVHVPAGTDRFRSRSGGSARGRWIAEARDAAQRDRRDEGRLAKRPGRLRRRRLLRRLLQPAGSGDRQRHRGPAIDRAAALQGHRRRRRTTSGQRPVDQGERRLERCALRRLRDRYRRHANATGGQSPGADAERARRRRTPVRARSRLARLVDVELDRRSTG